MNEEQAKEILNDPKKLLDMFRVFHQMIHIYEAQELKKQMQAKGPTQENMGLSDNLSIQLNNQEVK